MHIDFALVGVSLVLLVLGAEGLVRGSASLALRVGLPPLIVGLTIVAAGTSAPEMVVSIQAVQTGQGDIAIGNVVGSNIFNIGLILGLTALIHPLRVHPRIARLDAPIALAAALVLPILLWNRSLAPLEGMLLLTALVAYTANGFRLARRAGPDGADGDDLDPPSKHWALDVAFVLGGLALLVTGSELLVTNAVDLARGLGVDEAVIGLTIIAAGTSAPELATSLVAAFRRQADIAIGNVIGSNLFNALGILGVASLVGDLRTDGISLVDYATMVGLSALLVIMMLRRPELGRAEGALLLVAFLAWMAWLWPV
ncbi:MAG TPA: calcium/sodium antiporter [Pseudomonadales bacterium]|nr:calcium/sodium antiporter [Pseudomonadales bacterium]